HAAKEGIVDAAHSIQIGIRTPNPETHGFNILDARWLHEHGPRAAAEKVRSLLGARAAYLTLDIDFLDPVYAPGTGTPVVGGPTTARAGGVWLGGGGLTGGGGDQCEVSPLWGGPGRVPSVGGAPLGGDFLYLIGWAPSGRRFATYLGAGFPPASHEAGWRNAPG